MQADSKKYLWKVYTPDNVFLGIWDDVISELSFSEQLETYGSTIDVELARNSDSVSQTLTNLSTESLVDITTESGDPLSVSQETTNQIGPGTTVDEDLKVRVYVFYGTQDELSTEDSIILTTESGDDILASLGATNGRCKFNGYISRYNTRYGESESTTVTLTSDGDQLDNYVIEDEGDTTIAYNSYDPSNIAKAILDLEIEQGGDITYSSSTITSSGTTVSYTFNTNTTSEGLKKSTELSPSDWFSYLDMGTNEFHLHPKPSEVSHTFVKGVHYKQLDLEKSIEDMVNIIYFVGGETSPDVNFYKKYTRPASIAQYGRKLKIMTDNRVTLEDSADLIADSEIDRYASPSYKTTLDIVDGPYDIESLVLGQLVQFRNHGNYVDDLKLQIVGLTYHENYVTLQLDTLLPSYGKRVEDLKRNLDAVNTVNNPASPIE